MIDFLKEYLSKINTDYAELHFEDVRSTKIIITDKSIDAVNYYTVSSGNVRVLDKGGWGFASFSGKDFEDTAKKAIENAKIISKNRKDNIKIYKSKKSIKDEIITDYKIHPDTYSLKDKFDIANRYLNKLKDPRLSSCKVVYSDQIIEKYFLNSEGSIIKQTKIFTGSSLSVMAQEGNNIQQAFKSVGQYGGLELVNNLDEYCEEIKETVFNLLKAEKVKAGKYKVLLDPNLAGVFCHEAFGHLSEADFLYEYPEFQDVMKIGKEFGPEFLNIIDDGSLKNLAGYTPYDDEGIESRKNYLIKNGKLHGRLHSRETAIKMNEDITGNARAINPKHQPIVRMTNTYIDNDKYSFNDLLSMIDEGIYAIDYIGGMTNLEMFTFTAAKAYEIKNGKITRPLRDVTLSGNVFTTLKNIIAIGNDLTFHGGLGGCGKSGQSGLPVATGSPHLVIDNVLIGGN